MTTQTAFFEVCQDARPAAACYLSLYLETPYFGGPEEGGWWGSDVHLIAYQSFATTELAEAAQAKIQETVDAWNTEELREFGDHCRSQTDWLDARGLDDSYLPEVDGQSEYFTSLEETVGSHVSRGERQYS